MNKPNSAMKSKNDVCECNSGLPYKYCCIIKYPPKREITVVLDPLKKLGAKVDLTNDIVNVSSTLQLPLKYFCKDFYFYFFGILSLEQCNTIYTKLKNKDLQKHDILEAYKQTLDKGYAELLLQRAINEIEVFRECQQQISSILKAHYNGDYALTIPTLFILLERVLRKVGGLKNSDKLRPAIPVKIWEEAGMYFVEDDARNFNYFVHKLFEGSQDENTFNRNTILHGFNISYCSEEHSLLLILSLLEIRLFEIWRREIDSFPKTVQSSLIESFVGHELKAGDRYRLKVDGIGHDIEILQM